MSHACPHRHRTRAQGEAVGGLRHRLARVESGREERRARLGDARVLSGALPAGPGSRRDGTRVRRRRAPRDRGGQGRNRFDRLLGHLLLALRDRAGADGRGGARARDHAACGPAGRSSTASRRGCRRRCARARAGRTRPRPDHPPHHPHRKRGLREKVGLRIPEEAALTPDGLRQLSRGLRRGDARLQRRGASGACGRGRYRSSSATLPSTRSTMRGRWRTRTSPPGGASPTPPAPPPPAATPSSGSCREPAARPTVGMGICPGRGRGVGVRGCLLAASPVAARGVRAIDAPEDRAPAEKTGAQEHRYQATSMVLASRDHGPELCLGWVADSSAAVPWAADHQLALGPGRGGTGGRRHDLGHLPAGGHLRRRQVHRRPRRVGPADVAAEWPRSCSRTSPDRRRATASAARPSASATTGATRSPACTSPG